jgi:LytS/YehU family sensor histidine kinase
MNPHFMFNALNAIQSMIYSEDKKKAMDYLAKFSLLMRKILTNSIKSVISLDEEIEMLLLYLEIEQARYGKLFSYRIHLDPTLESDEVAIPPMLIQPFVENAIEHGLLHKQGEKQLLMQFEKETGGDNLRIIIEDNGVGRQQSQAYKEQRPSHMSFANEANEKRINLIQQRYQKEASLEIEDLIDRQGHAAGTRVTIKIPMHLEES